MVTMTDTAAKKISELRLEEGKPEWGLRIRIVGGGCSGMSYELGWEDAARGRQRRRGRAGHQGLHRQEQRGLSVGQRDRFRAERHDGRRVRDQEPERQVVLRLRPVPPLLSSKTCASASASSPGTEKPPGKSGWTWTSPRAGPSRRPGKRSSPAIPISRATARTPSSRSATTTSNPITASPPTTSSACSRR